MAIWNRITALVTGGAVATAAADALAPEFEVLKQTAWSNEPHRVLAPDVAAHLRARETTTEVQGIGLEGVDLKDDAARGGVGSARFDLLTELARTEPGVAELLQLRRRGIATSDAEGIGATEFRRLMRRQGYEASWITEVEQLLNERLTPQQVALGIVRSILDDAGLLVKKLDTGPGNVPRYPVSPIDPVAEAGVFGIDRERLRVMVGEIGLPMPAIMAANALFRSILTKTDYNAAISEGDVRPEWGDAILEASRQILTAHDAAELQLRGYLDRGQRLDHTDQHGMSHGDSDLLYDLLGRSISVHQVLVGFRRGGTYNGPTDHIPDAYLDALRRGNLRPEYYNLAYAGRETYPSSFVVRALLQSGAINRARGEELFLGMGWPEDVAKSAATTYAVTTSGSPSALVKRAESQLWTTLHTSFRNGDADIAKAEEILTEIEPDAGARSAIIGLWSLERTLPRKTLTRTDIRKQFREQTLTREQAVAEQVALGYSEESANAYLDE